MILVLHPEQVADLIETATDLGISLDELLDDLERSGDLLALPRPATLTA